MSDAANGGRKPAEPPPKSAFDRSVVYAQGIAILAAFAISGFNARFVYAQGIAILVALAISGFNAWFHLPDREARLLQAVFDDQLAITKLYFEKMAGLKAQALGEAQIVSLVSAYKTLPPNTMEIWLRAP